MVTSPLLERISGWCWIKTATTSIWTQPAHNESSIAEALAAISPPPFRSGEGWGQGSPLALFVHPRLVVDFALGLLRLQQEAITSRTTNRCAFSQRAQCSRKSARSSFL